MAAWVVTGVLSCLGALAYAELGAMMPASGGPYVFVRAAWGPLIAFLCGWTYFFVVISAALAWMGIMFATYLGQFFDLGSAGKIGAALAMIAVVTAVNYLGVRLGASVQRTLTALKVAGLAVLVGGAWFSGVPPASAAAAGPVTVSGFGVAMIACLTAYDGWIALSAVAGEVRNPQRNIALGAVIGTV